MTPESSVSWTPGVTADLYESCEYGAPRRAVSGRRVFAPSRRAADSPLCGSRERVPRARRLAPLKECEKRGCTERRPRVEGINVSQRREVDGPSLTSFATTAKPLESADQEERFPDRPWKRKWLPKPVDSSGRGRHRYQPAGSETNGAGRCRGFGNGPSRHATLHLDLIDQLLQLGGHLG